MPPAAVLTRSAGAELQRLQQRLEALYRLEPGPDIVPFVQVESEGREQVIVRQSGDHLELAVLLPSDCLPALMAPAHEQDTDAYLEAIEGVSHFTHLAERARTQLPTTLLELELQAEVDKFALLAPGARRKGRLELRRLHRRLYEEVRFLHAPGTERGMRYRLANDLAAKLWAAWIQDGEGDAVQGLLHRFYRVGQADKIRMAYAA